MTFGATFFGVVVSRVVFTNFPSGPVMPAPWNALEKAGLEVDVSVGTWAPGVGSNGSQPYLGKYTSTQACASRSLTR